MSNNIKSNAIHHITPEQLSNVLSRLGDGADNSKYVYIDGRWVNVSPKPAPNLDILRGKNV